jgi:hypothetical protein
MSAPPSQSPNLDVTENAKKADLDKKRNGKKGTSKFVIVLIAMVVALSTIGGAWMVVGLSIHSKVQADWLAAMRHMVTKDVGKPLPLVSPDPTAPDRSITPGPLSDAIPAPATSAPAPEVPPATPAPTPEATPEVPEAIPEVPEATPEVRRAMPAQTLEVRRAMTVPTPTASPLKPNPPTDSDLAFISLINKLLLEHDWRSLTAFTVNGQVNYFEHPDSTNAFIRDQLTAEATEMCIIHSTIDPGSFIHRGVK